MITVVMMARLSANLATRDRGGACVREGDGRASASSRGMIHTSRLALLGSGCTMSDVGRAVGQARVIRRIVYLGALPGRLDERLCKVGSRSAWMSAT